MADVFRQPLVAPRPSKKAADQSFRAPNLLLTTLAVVAVAPFLGRTFDNPVVRKAAAQQQTVVGRSPDWMIAPQEKPGTFEFFHQPGPRKANIQPALTATGRSPAWMIAPQVQPAPFEFFDQPAAKHAAQQPQPLPNLLEGTLAPTVTAFPVGRQQDFPNPAKRIYGEAPFESTVYMPVADAFPVGRQQDFPNPVIRKHMLRVTHWRSSYDPPAPPTPMPVGRQLDFQNPVTYRRSLTGMEFEHGHYADLPDYLLTSIQHDWPNPVRRKPAAQPVFQPPNLLSSTLYLPPAPFPIGRQQDFPNPVRAKYTQIRYEFSGTPVPNEIPPAVVPPEPVPSGYIGGGGGGGGGPWYKETRKRPTVYDRLHQDIKEVVIDPKFIRDVYEELMASDEAAPALEKAVRVPKAASGANDWDAMARDEEQVRALMLQARAEQMRREIAEDDADWEWF